MVEVVETLRDQVEKLNLVIAGLEDRSKLAYPAEYDLGKSLLNEVEVEIRGVKNRLSKGAYQSWLSSRL